jgi:hypothetical protein
MSARPALRVLKVENAKGLLNALETIEQQWKDTKKKTNQDSFRRLPPLMGSQDKAQAAEAESSAKAVLPA